MAADSKRRPPNAGRGRKRGIPNKLTGDIRSMIAGALADVGGKHYLAEQARENPPAFLALVGRTVPRDVNVALTGALKLLLDGHGVKRDDG